jgi:hypothetical protein
MGRFVATRGRARLAVGLCDRCQFKMPLDDLCSDGDQPGLRVCAACCDQIDPWRLPPPKPDDFVIADASPDTVLLPEEEA